MISIIVAMTKNNVIGNNGLIPWNIKGEQARFKELTLGNTIIMGRRSYEEIGKPLPNRKTILISQTLNVNSANCVTVISLKEALSLVIDEEEVFIAGGGRVYEEAMPLADRLYITVIDIEIKGDTFFPIFNKTEFKKVYEKKIDAQIPYTYFTFDKKS